MRTRLFMVGSAVGAALLVGCTDGRDANAPSDLGTVATTVEESPIARARLAGLRDRFAAPYGGVRHGGTERVPLLRPSVAHHFESDGSRLVPRLPGTAEGNADLALPIRASDSFRLSDRRSGVSAEVLLEGARDVNAEATEGVLVYPGAHASGADLFHRPMGDGTEDFLAFEQAPAAEEVSYRIRLGDGVAGLRIVAGTLELVDAGGAPRLRVTPPYLVDADGARHEAPLAVEGCAVDTDPAPPWGRAPVTPGAETCTVRIRWAGAKVHYPAVLDPSWSATGSMIYGRDAHSATQLPNGKVLIVGGYGGWDLNTAELFDPQTRTFSVTNSMTWARYYHSATLLPNGKVLVAGGWGWPYNQATAELYDPNTGSWSSAGSMSTPRNLHSAVLLDDGRVLVAGGFPNLNTSVWLGLASAEIYNPSTNSWSTTAPMTGARFWPGAAKLPGGRVLVAGGDSTSAAGGQLRTAEIYTPGVGWRAAPNLSVARYAPTMTALSNGKVLVAGGVDTTPAALASAELYDPTQNAFSPTGAMAKLRAGHYDTLLPSGKVLIVGGNDQTLVELYDPATETFSAAGNTSIYRSAHAQAPLAGGGVLVTGGWYGGPMSSAEVWFQCATADGVCRGAGSACDAANQCESNYCVDGVCCNSACGSGDPADCQACSIAAGAASDGSCGVVSAGLTCRAAHDTCDSPEVCAGTSTACPADATTGDGDRDSACDVEDNCPTQPNTSQLDTDGDGIGDVCDGCGSDPEKTAPGVCGCGASDLDGDGDGVADCNDACPADGAKIASGACGCGVSDVDNDSDGTPDCHDACPASPIKVAPGVCGCTTADVDTDGDATADCIDACAADPLKIAAGACGCGITDADGDGDGTPDCHDACAADPAKLVPGACGCGVADSDGDGDGTPDCHDACAADPGKLAPGMCGCGIADGDGDGDGTPDCHDACAADSGKLAPGACGCGVADTDGDGDGTPDCHDACAADPGKLAPGACGCDVADVDTDADGMLDCHDACPTDPGNDPDGDGACANDDNCGSVANASQVDADLDGVGDACDNCPADANADQVDADGDGYGEVCDDNIAPTVTLDTLPALTGEARVIVGATASDEHGVIRVSFAVNGTQVATVVPAGDGRVSATIDLVEGHNTIVVQAEDARQNVGAMSADIESDTTAPVLHITSPSAGQAFGTSAVSVTAELSDATPVTVAIDGGDPQSQAAGSSLYAGVAQLVSEGAQTITLIATDGVGNQTVATVPVLLDFSAPIVTTDLADGTRLGPQPGDTLLVTAHVDDLTASNAVFSFGGSIALPRDGGVVQGAAQLQSGTNVISLTVTNEVGLTTILTRTVIYDVTAPVASFVTPTPESWARGTIELAIAATDDLGSVADASFMVADSPIPATQGLGNVWTKSFNTTLLADGNVTVTATVTDLVGNSRSISEQLAIDNTAPSLAFGLADGSTVAGSVHLLSTASDSGSGVASIAITVNGMPAGTCAAGTCDVVFDTHALPNGPFTVVAITTDVAGNQTVAQQQLVADNTAPARFLVSPTTGTNVKGTLTIAVNVTDPDFASAECFFDGVSLGVSTTPSFTKMVDTLATLDGMSSVRCTATDRAGNVGTETATVTVKNWKLTFTPETLNLKTKEAKKVAMRATGRNVELLLPLASANLTIAVPGGTRVPAFVGRPCWDNRERDDDDDDCSGRDIEKVLVKFDRVAFVASVKAAIASGQVDPNKPVTVRLFAGTRELGYDTVKVKH